MARTHHVTALPTPRPVLLALASLVLLLPMPARVHAVEVTIDAYDSGWILPTEYHITSNENYAAGFSETNAYYYRNFFRFDLSGASSPVTAAILRIHLGTYASQDPSEIYAVYDAPVLQYAQLGSGTLYGAREIFAAETGAVDIVLNGAAVAAINTALGGLFDVGGAVTSLDASPTTSELLFGNTNQFSTRQLILNPIPEPSTALLLGLGLGAVGLRRAQLVKKSARGVPVAS